MQNTFVDASLVTTIVGSVFSVMLGLIVFFLHRLVTKLDSTGEKLDKTAETTVENTTEIRNMKEMFQQFMARDKKR